MQEFHTINPATEEIVSTYSYQSPVVLDGKVANSYKTWTSWRKTPIAQRSELLMNVAKILREKQSPLSRLITIEMGKPLDQSQAEIEKCALVCEYYAENGDNFLQDELIQSDAKKSFISYDPIGPILAIMPWNFPFWQVFRFAAPNLIAGNTGLLKHSPNTTGCALKIQEIFLEAGFPEGAFITILAQTDHVEAIISSDQVAGVTLTGSTKAGKSVAALSGKYLKKTVLELGGSDPYVILDDADLTLAADKCVTGRLINTGQSCIAAKRFIVTEKNADEFTEKVRMLMSQKRFGDPLSGEYSLGTMARIDLREQLHQQVTQSINAGAKCLLGGKNPDTTGYYYPATLLSHVSEGMPAFNKELFGPVASIIMAKDEHHAIDIANDTAYGLGAAIFTQDTERAIYLSRGIEAGCVYINDFVKSDPRLPFGGVKSSGYGRELSPLGIKEFVNAKTIYVG